MKPAPFDMLRPTEVDEVLALLSEEPEDSKVLAGGQSLVPMMNFRLARPARVVDINRVKGLNGIENSSTAVTIRSCTRHLTLQNNLIPGPLGRLLRQTATKIGHLPIRTRGTFGGSIAHCDSASEWCVVATLLDAEMMVRSQRGTRTIGASSFFRSALTTALQDDELLTATVLPVLDDSYHVGLTEFSRRQGDFGIVLTAVVIRVLDDVVTEARICVGGVAPIPVRCPAAEQGCLGRTWTPAVLDYAAETAAAEVDPASDAHGDADYRRALVRALLPRTVEPIRFGRTA